MLVNYKNVIAKLEIEYPQYNWVAMEERVKLLAAEATRVSSTNQMKTTIGDREPFWIDVENGIAELPQNCYQWLNSYGEDGSEIECYEESNLLKPSRLYEGKMRIVFKALPVDEDGFPIILEQQFDYVFYSVLVSVLREEYFNGKLNGNMWQELMLSRDAAYKVATTEKLSTQKKDRLVRLAKTARYYPINPKRF